MPAHRGTPHLVAAIALALTLATPLVASGDGELVTRAETSPRRAATTAHVLAISIDSMGTTAVRRLGRSGLPHVYRLLDEGASTLNARTAREQTVTLPNHTGMVTGRRIDRSRGGHGVTWNDDRPGTTVQGAAGHGVSSVFTVVKADGRSTALFSTKSKFSLFKRSWDRGIDRFRVAVEDDRALLKAARADLVQRGRALTFVHFGGADKAGHDHGFLGPRYFAALRRLDRFIGNLLRALGNHPALADTVVVLTADHGGIGQGHSDPTMRANYAVPLVVWGDGVTHGDLYDLNPAYADPGRTRTGYAGQQPIRNADLANLVTDLLGLPAVPGSEFGASVDWRL